MEGVKFLISCFAIIVICFNNVSSSIRDNAICGTTVPCNDSQCIDRGRWCDGNQDCDDNSDEIYCKERMWYQISSPNECDETYYLVCDNGRCVPIVVVCDGYDDCEDQSDEALIYCNPVTSVIQHEDTQTEDQNKLPTDFPIPSTTLSPRPTRGTPTIVPWTKTTAPIRNTITRTISSTEPTIDFYNSRTAETPPSTLGYSQTQQPMVFKNEYNQPVYNIYHRKETDDPYEYRQGSRDRHNIDERYTDFLSNRRYYDAVLNDHSNNHGIYCSCPSGARNPTYEYQLPSYLRGIHHPFVIVPFPFKKVTLSFE